MLFIMLEHLKICKKNKIKSSNFVVKSKTAMAPVGIFSGDKITWIIYKYGELKSISLVMRAYRLKFLKTKQKAMPSRTAFARVIQRFESTGGNAKCKDKREGLLRH